MADRTELRRLAEAARDDPSSLVKAAAYLYALDDPATTIALLDAAERADRLIVAAQELRRWHRNLWHDTVALTDLRAALGEVDRAE